MLLWWVLLLALSGLFVIVIVPFGDGPLTETKREKIVRSEIREELQLWRNLESWLDSNCMTGRTHFFPPCDARVHKIPTSQHLFVIVWTTHTDGWTGRNGMKRVVPQRRGRHQRLQRQLGVPTSPKTTRFIGLRCKFLASCHFVSCPSQPADWFHRNHHSIQTNTHTFTQPIRLVQS